MKRICENPPNMFMGQTRVHMQRKVALAFLIVVVGCLQATAIPAQAQPTSADKTGSAAIKIEGTGNGTGESSGDALSIISLKLEQCRTESNVTRREITTTKTGKNPKLTDVRLPKSLKPVKYLIRLQPFINGNFSIAGYIEITFEALNSTTNVTLHIIDIIPKKETITLKPINDLTGKRMTITEHRYDTDREFYIAMLGEDLVAGKQYVLTMQFEGLLNDKLFGFYRSQYKDPQGKTRWLAATQFQPADARTAFPASTNRP